MQLGGHRSEEPPWCSGCVQSPAFSLLCTRPYRDVFPFAHFPLNCEPLEAEARPLYLALVPSAAGKRTKEAGAAVELVLTTDDSAMIVYFRNLVPCPRFRSFLHRRSCAHSTWDKTELLGLPPHVPGSRVPVVSAALGEPQGHGNSLERSVHQGACFSSRDSLEFFDGGMRLQLPPQLGPQVGRGMVSPSGGWASWGDSLPPTGQ